MNDLRTEAEKLKEPAMVAALAGIVGFSSKQLFKMSFGIENNGAVGAVKAFVLVTASGYAVNWYNKRE